MKLNLNIKSTSNRKGFTLIELLVSMSVTMVIIGVLMAMTRVAVNGMVTSQNATRSSRISQDILATVSKDLEGLVIRSGNDYEWLNVKKNGNSVDQLGPSVSKNMQNPIEMSFFSATTDRYNGDIGGTSDLGGDISYVRYKLVYKDIIPTAGGADFRIFSLYRKRIEPNDTFDDYLTLEEPNIPEFGDVGGDDFLAENIFDMTVTFNFESLVTDGSTSYYSYKRVPIQVNGTEFRSLSITGNNAIVTGSGDLTPPINGGAYRLQSADISILVLTDAGMNGLRTANIRDDEELSDYLELNGKNFSKSVILPRP